MKYRLEYYDTMTDQLVATLEGDDLDKLHSEGYHYLDTCYGREFVEVEG